MTGCQCQFSREQNVLNRDGDFGQRHSEIILRCVRCFDPFTSWYVRATILNDPSLCPSEVFYSVRYWRWIAVYFIPLQRHHRRPSSLVSPRLSPRLPDSIVAVLRKHLFVSSKAHLHRAQFIATYLAPLKLLRVPASGKIPNASTFSGSGQPFSSATRTGCVQRVSSHIYQTPLSTCYTQ